MLKLDPLNNTFDWELHNFIKENGQNLDVNKLDKLYEVGVVIRPDASSEFSTRVYNIDGSDFETIRYNGNSYIDKELLFKPTVTFLSGYHWAVVYTLLSEPSQHKDLQKWILDTMAKNQSARIDHQKLVLKKSEDQLAEMLRLVGKINNEVL